jgi:prevent-host-death family protein
MSLELPVEQPAWQVARGLPAGPPICAARAGGACLSPVVAAARCYRQGMAYPLTAAQTHLGELVDQARDSHRPVTISQDGMPVAALISIDDLADLQDRAALAVHLVDKAAGRNPVGLDDLDAALDRIDAQTRS